MNSLEKYVVDNKRLFDEEPPAGHFERLQQKITRKSTRIITLRWGLSIAASITILMTAGIIWLNPAKQHEILLCENAHDLKICYLDKMNDIAGQIEALIQDFDPWSQQQLMYDVQSIFEAVNSDLESELPEELPEDKIKEILSDYYRQNLEGLEMIQQMIIN